MFFPVLANVAYAKELLGDEAWLNVGDPVWSEGVLKPALADEVGLHALVLPLMGYCRR